MAPWWTLGGAWARPRSCPLALGLSGELGWWTGRWASAYADATEALQWAEEMNQAGLIGHALSQLSRIAAARGDRERCEEHVERARQDVEPHGVGCLAVYNAAALGLCALSCGDLTTAIDHLERAWDAGQAAGLGNPNVVPFAGDLAEALARVGAAERAQAGPGLAPGAGRRDGPGLPAGRGRAGARDPRPRSGRSRGLVRHGPRRRTSRQPMPFEQARTLLCQGEALRRGRRPAASRRPLRHALTIFTGLDARPWAARAMIELDATGARADTRNTASASALDSPQPARTPSRPRRRARTQQRRGRGGPVRLPQDRGSPPHPRLPQTRRPVPHRTDPPAGHMRPDPPASGSRTAETWAMAGDVGISLKRRVCQQC